jgi:hypothetical protein
MQNLKQRLLLVREYTEELYKVNIKSRYIEYNTEKVASYINGLRLGIHDEISLLFPNT